MTYPTEDESYHQDQKDQRAHERNMAEERRRFLEGRRNFIGSVLAGVAIVTVLSAIVTAIVFGVRHSNDTDLKIEKERARIAQLCIEADHIWINNNCIPTEPTYLPK